MKQTLALIIIVLLGWAEPAGWSQTNDPQASLRQFSQFSQVDFGRLLGGDILTARGDLMNYANGISAESCYAVLAKPDVAAKQTQQWNPSPHTALKVYAYESLQVPCVPADFQDLTGKARKHSLRSLLDKTLAITDQSTEFNLAHKEVTELGDCLKSGHTEDNLANCWARLLSDRVQTVEHGGFTGVLPYETGGGSFHSITEIRSLLLDQPKIAAEFAPILNACGLLKRNKELDLSPFYYWSLFDADHHDTFNLGVIFLLAVGDHYQLADVEYYVSGSFYAELTLYEIWPISAGGKSGSLVWRGDLLSAPILAYTKGTERIAYGALMLQDIKKSIRFLQDDIKGSR